MLGGVTLLNIEKKIAQVFKKQMIYNIIKNVIGTGFSIYTANVLSNLMNNALAGKVNLLLSSAVFFLCIFTLYNIIFALFSYLFILDLQRNKQKINIIFLSRFLDNRFIDSMSFTAGQIQNRFKDDLQNVQKVVSEILPLLPVNALIVIGYIVYLSFRGDPLLVIAATILSILQIIISKAYNPAFASLFKNIQKSEDEIIEHIKKSVYNYKEITSLGIQPYMLKRYEHLLNKNQEISLQIEKKNTTRDILCKTIKYISQFGTYIMLGISLLLQRIDISYAVEFLYLWSQVMGYFDAIANAIKPIREKTVSAKRIEELFKEEEQDNEEFDTFKRINLNMVSFAYKKEELPILYNFNLDISANEKIVILGPNGCGKTTLSYLIMGLMKPSNGYITHNEKKLHNSKFYVNYVRKFSWLSQNITLFPYTVIENIELVNPLVKKEQISYLFEYFKLDKLILTEHIDNLSSGQKQMILIIRELLKDKEIYLMDEPTSYLDKERTSLLINYIQKQKKTFIIISHDEDIKALPYKQVILGDVNYEK